MNEERLKIERLKALQRAKVRLIEMGNLVVNGQCYELKVPTNVWHSIFMTDDCKREGICREKV